MQVTRHSCCEAGFWVAAVIFGAVPGLMALDYGGNLPWTQLVASLVLAAGCVFAISAQALKLGDRFAGRIPPSGLWLPSLLGLLLIFTWIQTISLPPALIRWLSPASYDAYLSWAGVLIPQRPSPQAIPISISPVDSARAVSWLVIATLLSCCSVFAFNDRRRIMWLLSALAVGGCSVAIIGIARKSIPGFHLWSFQEGGEGAPFGTFLNRNNAALAMNTGIGCALGLLVWRRAATVIARDEHANGSKWLLDLPVLCALGAAAISLLGIVTCGSRGGMLTTVLAGAVTLFLLPQSFGKITGVVVGISLAAMIGLAALRSDSLVSRSLDGDSVSQLGATVSGQRAGDARLSHWPDGWRAALAYLPMGSGLGTYGYAYLPYQETSPWRWYVHADNLWLEMLVETGLPGALLAITVAWLFITAIRKLNRSPDPIDQGIRAAGIFIALAVAVSQFFDFGLIMPANLLAVLAFAPIVILRASLLTESRRRTAGGPKLELLPAQKSWWRSRPIISGQVLPMAMAVGLLLLSLPSIAWLRRDAEADLVRRDAAGILLAAQSRPRELEQTAAELRRIVAKHATPELHDLQAECQFQRGRLLELEGLGRSTSDPEAYQALYRRLSLDQRRLGWRASRKETKATVERTGRAIVATPMCGRTPQALTAYGDALDDTFESIRLCPLAMTHRIRLANLEFIDGDLNRTDEALRQSSQLFRNNAEIQLRIGTMFADHGNYGDASDCWHRATDLRPDMTRRIIAIAMGYNQFPMAKIVHGNSVTTKLARDYLQSRGVQLHAAYAPAARPVR